MFQIYRKSWLKRLVRGFEQPGKWSNFPTYASVCQRREQNQRHLTMLTSNLLRSLSYSVRYWISSIQKHINTYFVKWNICLGRRDLVGWVRQCRLKLFNASCFPMQMRSSQDAAPRETSAARFPSSRKVNKQNLQKRNVLARRGAEEVSKRF